MLFDPSPVKQLQAVSVCYSGIFFFDNLIYRFFFFLKIGLQVEKKKNTKDL